MNFYLFCFLNNTTNLGFNPKINLGPLYIVLWVLKLKSDEVRVQTELNARSRALISTWFIHHRILYIHYTATACSMWTRAFPLTLCLPSCSRTRVGSFVYRSRVWFCRTQCYLSISSAVFNDLLLWVYLHSETSVNSCFSM